jgi:hypothetical protein
MSELVKNMAPASVPQFGTNFNPHGAEIASTRIKQAVVLKPCILTHGFDADYHCSGAPRSGIAFIGVSYRGAFQSLRELRVPSLVVFLVVHVPLTLGEDCLQEESQVR